MSDSQGNQPLYSGGEAGFVGIATESRPDQPVAAPTTAPTAALVVAAGLVDNGTHAYVKVDITALGPSLPSAVSNIVTTVTADHGQVALTTIAVSASPLVIARGLYRSKAGTGSTGPFYLVATIADNTTTTFTDNVADASLGALAPTVGLQNGLPGFFVAPTQFLMAETNTFDETPAPISRDVYGANRDSDEGHSLGKALTGGNLGYGCYYNNGFEILVAAIGKDVGVSAIVSDTTVSITTPSVGQSVLNLSAGSGAYQVGMLAFIGAADINQEVRLVAAWDAGGKNLTVPLLRKTHASVGTTVVTVFQHKTMPLTASDTGRFSLRTLSIEDNVGGKYSNRYAGCLVGKYNLKGAPAKFEVQADMMSSFDRVLANGESGLPSPTAFNFSDPSWNDISFEFTDGFCYFPYDSTSSGTPTPQLVIDIDTWELDFSNTLLAKPTFDGTDTTRQFVMKREVAFKFTTLNPAAYPQLWRKFLKRQINLAFQIQVVKNIGTDVSPVWRAMSIYMPNVRCTKSAEIKGLTAIVGENVECAVLRSGGLEKLYVYSISDFATAV